MSVHMSTCIYLCVGVCAHICTCRDQRVTLNIFLNFPTHTTFETGSLHYIWNLFCARDLSMSTQSYLGQSCTATPGSLLGIQTQVIMLVWQTPSSSSRLPSHNWICFTSNSEFQLQRWFQLSDTQRIHQAMKGIPLNRSGIPGTPFSSNNIYFHSLKLTEHWAGMLALHHSTIWTLSIQSGISLLSPDGKETRSFPSIGNLCLLLCFLLQKPATPSPISFKISLSIDLYVGVRKHTKGGFAVWLRRKLKTRAQPTPSGWVLSVETSSLNP